MSNIVPVTAGDVMARLEAAARSLAEVRDVPEAKDIRDRAQAIQHYLRQQGYSLAAQNDAAELKLRAERRLGELLAATVRPGNPQLSHDATIGRLPAGITRTQSSRWQAVASVPGPVFERHVAEARG